MSQLKSAFAARQAKQKAHPISEIPGTHRQAGHASPSKDNAASTQPQKRRKTDPGPLGAPSGPRLPTEDQRAKNGSTVKQTIKGKDGLRPHMIASSLYVFNGTTTAKADNPSNSTNGQSDQYLGLDVSENSNTEEEESNEIILSGDLDSSDLEQVPSPTHVIQVFTTGGNIYGKDERIIIDAATECHYSLKDSDTLVLLGCYDLWVRRGMISVDGARLQASSQLHRIFAPSTQSLPVIKALPSPYKAAGQSTELAISSCSPGLRLLRQVCPKFGRIWNHSQRGELSQKSRNVELGQRTFLALRSSRDDRYNRPLRSMNQPAETTSLVQKMLNSKQKSMSVMLCGPKGTGKSTLARQLLNGALSCGADRPENAMTLARGVILLDLDPGQPEFSPPGEISLFRLRSNKFGPSFTHPTVGGFAGDMVIRTHHLGTLSPSADPGYYLECASDLIERYRTGFSDCPLIVNSCGWVQGTGLELLVELIRYRFLTDVIYTSTSGPGEAISKIQTTTHAQRIPLHLISSGANGVSATPSGNLRIMQTLSYFHLDEPEEGNLRWNPEPLSCRPPLIVHYAGPQQAIFGVMVLGDRLDPELYFGVLEGCIVGLVIVEHNFAMETMDGHNDEDESPADTASLMLDAHDHSPTIHPALPTSTQSLLTAIHGNSIGLPLPEMHDSPHQGSNAEDIPNTASSIDTDVTPSHLIHHSIKRTTSNLPYISSTTSSGATIRPLSPKYSRCIGQALIRGIDSHNHALHLITPIPSSRLQDLHRQKMRIVLVRGKLDTPTWAYQEEMHLMRSRMTGSASSNHDEESKAFERQMMREWAEGVPWASVREPSFHGRGGGKRASWRPWRARRDIRGPGEDSE